MARGKRAAGWSTDAYQVVNRVFVYGTFRAGETARAVIAAHVTSSQPGTLTGTIYALPEGYPGLVQEGDGTVVGELLELDDLMGAFALLDAYEGDDFIRTMREATTADGTRTWAWCYELKDPSYGRRAGERIPSGDWVAWRTSQDS